MCGIILLLLTCTRGWIVVFGGVGWFAIIVGLIVNFECVMECVAVGFW